MHVSIDLDEMVAADDYWWFEARPNRTFRLRHATEDDRSASVQAMPCSCSVQRSRFDALAAENTDAALAPHFAKCLDELVKEQGNGPSLARRWRKLFQIVREHGRLSALPSRETLDQP
jgi:hypothetical protein